MIRNDAVTIYGGDDESSTNLFNKILIKYKSQDQNQHIICCLLRIKEIKPFLFYIPNENML